MQGLKTRATFALAQRRKNGLKYGGFLPVETGHVADSWSASERCMRKCIAIRLAPRFFNGEEIRERGGLYPVPRCAAASLQSRVRLYFG
jgi:hypothetical protein